MTHLTRRRFIRTTGAGLAGAAVASSASSYARILGANERVRVGIVGFSDRCRSALIPAFLKHADELDFEIVAVSDIWSLRREQAVAHLEKLTDEAGRGRAQQRGAVRAQGRGRRHRRDRRLPARVARGGGGAGGTRRLRGEAARQHDGRRARDPAGGEGNRPNRADRHAAPERPGLPEGVRLHPRPASSARSSAWR